MFVFGNDPLLVLVYKCRARVLSQQVSTESAEGEEVKNVVEFRAAAGLEYSQPSQPQKEKKRTGSSSASPDKKVKVRGSSRCARAVPCCIASHHHSFVAFIPSESTYSSGLIYIV